jgi:hypothetical protein
VVVVGVPGADRSSVDGVFEDGVLGQRVKEVFSVHEPAQSLGDDPEERGERLEAGPAGHGCAAGRAQARALRWAKSAKLAGGDPVTFRTSSLGREPCPEAIVAVSQSSMTR